MSRSSISRSTRHLSTLAYGKGALGFLAIRNAIGDDAFIERWRSYADAFRLGIAEPADLLAAFETASGQEFTGALDLLVRICRNHPSRCRGAGSGDRRLAHSTA